MTGIATPPSGGGRRAQCTEAAAAVGAFSTQLCAAVIEVGGAIARGAVAANTAKTAHPGIHSGLVHLIGE